MRPKPLSGKTMKQLTLLFSIIVFAAGMCLAQTSAFTYQGKLASSGAPANGDYQLEFKLFDASTGTNQIGTTQTATAPVQNGAFSVRLDFGASAFPAGADRWLQISVRASASNPYTVLNPRQQLSSVPFAVRSLKSNTADNADNATSLAGVTASNYVQTSDSRLSDARTPTAGSDHYIQNLPGIGQQAASFNISGAGSANTLNATTQYNIAGNRVLSVGADGNNVFAGVLAGQANNTAGINNSFFGFASGHSNIDGQNNAFFGKTSGFSNSTGRFNSFFGPGAGQSNVTGDNNTTVGALADVGAPNLNFATAVGAGAVVSSSNTVVLGRSTDTVQIPGSVNIVGGVSRFNPSLLGQLRWDLLNTNHVIPVGSGPSGMAFDGTFIYVANSQSNNVTRIRAATGVVEGSPIAVGSSPLTLAFDGTFMYVANNGGSDVTRIRASTGVVEGSPIAVGDHPYGLAFDGTYMYVANSSINSVTRILASSGAVAGSIDVGSRPFGLTFDGTFIYVSTPALGQVSRIRASTGLVEGNPITSGQTPVGMAFDGTFVYVANIDTTDVTRIRASTGVVEGFIAIGGHPAQFAFDGTFMYVTDSNNNRVTKIRAIDGLVESNPIVVGSFPMGLAFDGAVMYVASNFSNTVIRF